MRASFSRRVSACSSDDLPTLERPAKAISGGPGGGKCSAPLADFSNSASITRMRSVSITESMRTIGLTGGIASGKSTVAKFLEELGAPVVDADQIAREVVQPGHPAFDEI